MKQEQLETALRLKLKVLGHQKALMRKLLNLYPRLKKNLSGCWSGGLKLLKD